MTISTDIEKLVDTFLKKVYAQKPQRILKHKKKIKKIRKRKNKKLALHNQFRYADKLLQYNQKRIGKKPTSLYTSKRRRALQRMTEPRLSKVYNETQMRSYMNPHTYTDFKNIYRSLFELDWIAEQQQTYNNINTQHRMLQQYY